MSSKIAAVGLAFALGLAPAAFAQDQKPMVVAQQNSVPPEVTKYLQEQPDLKSMTPQQLQQRMRAGRAYMDIKGLPKNARNRVQQQVRAARAELDSRKTAAQPQQPAAEKKPAQPSADKKPAEQAKKPARDDGAAQAYIADATDVKSLSDQELTRRIRAGRGFVNDKSLPQAVRQKAGMKLRALRAEVAARQGKPAGNDQAGKKPETKPAAGDSVQAERVAKALVADDRAPRRLSNDELRTRLNAMRAALAAKNLSTPTERALRQKLALDRDELRKRVDNVDPNQGRPSAGWMEDRRPARDLSEQQLRNRIIALREAIASNRYTQRQRDVFKVQLTSDREELNRRIVVDKRRRYDDLRRYRDKTDVNIAINIINVPRVERPIGYYPPPVWAAEADMGMIENQLIAPPVRTPPRRYTVQQIEDDPQIRESMPAVELDTIHFGFGEAFIREEELENMDKVGEVLEKILAAHPGEVFLIEGHTDAVGSDASNLDLSRQRAQAVVDSLTSYYNVSPRNLKPVGYGERYLKIATDEEEPENRRVTVRRVTPLVGELEG